MATLLFAPFYLVFNLTKLPSKYLISFSGDQPKLSMTPQLLFSCSHVTFVIVSVLNNCVACKYISISNIKRAEIPSFYLLLSLSPLSICLTLLCHLVHHCSLTLLLLLVWSCKIFIGATSLMSWPCRPSPLGLWRATHFTPFLNSQNLHTIVNSQNLHTIVIYLCWLNLLSIFITFNLLWGLEFIWFKYKPCLTKSNKNSYLIIIGTATTTNYTSRCNTLTCLNFIL